MNTRIAGQIAEYKFLITAMELNWPIAIPAGASTLHQYDVLLFVGGQWQKVQIKSTQNVRASSGGEKRYVTIDLRRSLRTIGNKKARPRMYSDEAFDYLGAVYQDMVWLIPKSVVNKCSINLLSEKWDQYRVK